MNNNLSFKALCIVAGIFVGLLDAIEVHATQTEQAYTTAYRYDINGQLTGTIKPDPDGSGALRLLATRNNYSAGLLMSVDSGELASFPSEDVLATDWAGYGFSVNSRQEFHYDSYGRKDKVTSYDKNSAVISLTEYSYDSKSRLLCTALRMDLNAKGDACSSSNLTSLNPDRITRLTYDDIDQVTTEERAVGTSIQENYVSNVYDGKALRYQVDANCNKTELRYDPQWRLSRMVYPSTAVALSAGQTCDKPSTSNSLPNLAGGVNEGDYVEFGYDANGNKNYERKRNGTSITYTIDNNNRVIFKDYSNPNQPDIAYDYDLRGLQTSAKFGDDGGKGITTIYDGFGKVKSQTNSMFATSSTLNYGYDFNNNRKKIVHPDGATFNYQFDGLNRISQLDDTLGSNLVRVYYQSNGHRSTITRSNSTSTEYSFATNGVQLDKFKQNFAAPVVGAPTNNLINSFLYNNAGQISQLTLSNSLYYYQGNENRTGAYVTNGLNQYKQVGTVALGYDSNQNLLYDGFTYYTYDDENRLVGMTKVDDSTFNAKLVYDPNGRLFQTTINGTVTKFLYDGDALVAEYDGNETLKRRYVHGDQVDEPLVQYNSATTGASDRVFLHVDHQGSVIAQSDSTGKVKNALAYDTYGIPAVGNVGRFGYTGQIWLPELGLDYYKARVYSPKLGRFIQSDPIGLRGGINTYAYVRNNPIGFIDPTGLYGEAALAGFSTFVAADMAIPDPSDVAWPKWAGYVVAGGVLGGVVWATAPENAKDPKGPKAPGKPGEAEGYCEGKKGENWVPNPNGRGNGWEDENGHVWVPTGPGGQAHGGPHWDVQDPNGGYVNVYPGGARR